MARQTKHTPEGFKSRNIEKTHRGKIKKNKSDKQKLKTNAALKLQKECNGIQSYKTSAYEIKASQSTSSTGSSEKKLLQAANSSNCLQNISTSCSVLPGMSSPKAKSHELQSSLQKQTASSLPDPKTSMMKTSGDTHTMSDSSVKRKRKKGLKKVHDGMSNWASLCSKLKIDPARKNKPSKVQVEPKEEIAQVLEPKRPKPEVWFDNVDKILIEGEYAEDSPSISESDKHLVKPDSYKGVTHCIAMDCEMVGVGPNGEESILARVSLVNHYGICLFDKFVLPREKVTNYRTHVSGVTKENLSTGEEFSKVQREVSDIIKGKVLVGHALHNDLKVLFLTHPHKMIRDTSKYKPFRQLFKGGIPSLKKLADKILGVTVQEGQHSSVQDAQAAMRLYTMHRQRWEKELRQQDKKKMKTKRKKQGKEANS